MTKERGRDKSVSPSEVARSLFSNTWRSYLDEVHMAAVKLNRRGMKKITRKGKENDLEKSKGPVQLSLND